jgi:hypothetical protein
MVIYVEYLISKQANEQFRRIIYTSYFYLLYIQTSESKTLQNIFEVSSRFMRGFLEEYSKKPHKFLPPVIIDNRHDKNKNKLFLHRHDNQQNKR